MILVSLSIIAQTSGDKHGDPDENLRAGSSPDNGVSNDEKIPHRPIDIQVKTLPSTF